MVSSVQFSSVVQSCPTLCDPMNHSTPGLPVHHHLPEFTQTRVHRVSDAIQPSHPQLPPSPPAPNPSQHQSLFQWVNLRHKLIDFPNCWLLSHYYDLFVFLLVLFFAFLIILEILSKIMHEEFICLFLIFNFL